MCFLNIMRKLIHPVSQKCLSKSHSKDHLNVRPRWPRNHEAKGLLW